MAHILGRPPRQGDVANDKGVTLRVLGIKRHRASLGISEVSDAIVVVVSEETGQVSIATNGRIIRRQDPAQLGNILNAFLQGQPGALTEQ